MKYVHGRPPVYDRIVAAVGEPPRTSVITYGDTVYGGPDVTFPLPDDLIAHERLHTLQQRYQGFDSPEPWWEKWLEDPTFRFEQELAAYKAQLVVLAKTYKDRNALTRMRVSIARTLSGAMYGRVVDFHGAYARLT